MPQKRKSEVLPGDEKLLVPVSVSPDKPTKGFVPLKLLRDRGIDPIHALDVMDRTISSYAMKRGSHFIVERSPANLAVNDALIRAGYSGEKIVQALGGGKYLVEREGVSFAKSELVNIPADKALKLTEDVGSMIGTIHTLHGSYEENGKVIKFNAAAHNHPHERNLILLPSGKVGIIDMDDAEVKTIDWNDHLSVHNAFMVCYIHLSSFASNLFGRDFDQRPMVDKMLSKYPTPAAEKGRLLEQLSDIFHFRGHGEGP